MMVTSFAHISIAYHAPLFFVLVALLLSFVVPASVVFDLLFYILVKVANDRPRRLAFLLDSVDPAHLARYEQCKRHVGLVLSVRSDPISDALLLGKTWPDAKAWN